MSIDCIVTVDGNDYGFDFEDQRIDIDALVSSMKVTDLWTAIKSAQACELGIVFPQIATAEGLATLGTGVQTFITVKLLDNWEVNTLRASGKFECGGGNLIRADGSDPFRDNPLITYINFLSQAGIATLIETGTSGLTPSESAALLAIPTNPLLTNDARVDNLDAAISTRSTTTDVTDAQAAIQADLVGVATEVTAQAAVDAATATETKVDGLTPNVALIPALL